MEIKTWRDPYEAGFSPTRPTKIEINSGLTVLVGCNGAGKSTLLQNINEEMKNKGIPCHLHNNLTVSGSDSISEAIYSGDMGFGITLMESSEGECIKMHIGKLAKCYDEFIKTGFMNTKKNRFAKLFNNNEDTKKDIPDTRVLLFDAIDSGLSVDSVIEIKLMCDNLLEMAEKHNVELYIVIAANEYELARNSQCFDVNEGKYITFKDYEDYRKFIIKSRAKKEKRIEKQEVWYKKRREREEKAYYKAKEAANQKISKILKGRNYDEVEPGEKWKIDDIKRDLERIKPKWIEEEQNV